MPAKIRWSSSFIWLENIKKAAITFRALRLKLKSLNGTSASSILVSIMQLTKTSFSDSAILKMVVSVVGKKFCGQNNMQWQGTLCRAAMVQCRTSDNKVGAWVHKRSAAWVGFRDVLFRLTAIPLSVESPPAVSSEGWFCWVSWDAGICCIRRIIFVCSSLWPWMLSNGLSFPMQITCFYWNYCFSVNLLDWYRTDWPAVMNWWSMDWRPEELTRILPASQRWVWTE